MPEEDKNGLSDETMAVLLPKLRQGDSEAAAVVFGRFVTQLTSQIRRHGHLSKAVRRQLETADVLQLAFATFLRRIRAGELRLEYFGSLWRILVGIALDKSRNAAKRIRRRPKEISLATSDDAWSLEQGTYWDLIARGPSPEQEASFNETLAALLATFKSKNPEMDSRNREIVLQRLDACTTEEIATYFSTSERTVQRVIATAVDRLEQMKRANGIG